MKRKLNKKILIGILLYIVLFAYATYTLIGISFGPIVKKENGNYCRGYDYTLKICWGDINAE